MGRRRGLGTVLVALVLAALVLARPATARAATLDGVDISGWNQGINYGKLGDFVIIKATEYNPTKKNYTSYNDYQAQADAALKAGKLIGFYHFATSPTMKKGSSTVNGASMKQQARGFIDAISVKDAQGNYKYLGRAVLCLDWENTDYSSVESHVAWAKEWLDYVYEKTGVMPVIYTSRNCTADYNWSSVANAGYKLWGAMWLNKYADAYNKGTTGFVSNPDYSKYGNWGAWGARPTIYQYASNATLHGNKVYDVNKFYGSRSDWLELAYAGEYADGTYDPATLLEDGAIYSFSPSVDASAGLPVANVSNNAAMGSSTARSYSSGYWRVENLGDGTYRLASVSNGKRLSYPNGPASGSNVNLTGAADVWRAIKCTNGAIALEPVGTRGLRLDVANGKSTVSGTNVRLYRSNNTPAQRYHFTKAVGLNEAMASGQAVEDGVYTLSSALDASKFVEVAGSSAAKGANVQLNANTAKLGQRLQFVYKGNGLYTIKLHNSGLSLDVKGGAKTKGANVQQYTGNTTLAQLWYLKPIGDKYSVCSALSGLALDAAGGKSSDGTNLQIYTANGTKAQQFSLTRSEALTEALATGRVLADGVYRISLPTEEPLSAGVVASTANGANVQVAASARSRTQKFVLSYVTNGLYTVRSQHANKVLDVKGSSSVSGANVQQWKGNGSVAQLWYLVADEGGYQLRSAASGNALSVAGDEATDGANLCVMTPGSATTSQALRFEPAPVVDDGAYELSSGLLDTLALASADQSTAKGANVQVDGHTSVPTQQWVFEHLGDDVYTVRHAASGLVLEVQDGSKAKGGNVRLWSANGTVAQRWKVSVSDNGGIVLQNAKSGLVLDVAGGKKVAGTNVRQWTANGSVAQTFVEHAVEVVVEEALLAAADPEQDAEALAAPLAEAMPTEEAPLTAVEDAADGEAASDAVSGAAGTGVADDGETAQTDGVSAAEPQSSEPEGEEPTPEVVPES